MANEVVHLVLGDAAAGVLGEAMAGAAVPSAQIVRFRDIYCIGPLDALGTPGGAASRSDYWAQLLPDAPPALAEFEEEEGRYALAREAARQATLVPWVGAHSSSQLWLQRLASVLPSRPAEVRLIDVAEAADARRPRRTMSQFEPEELGRLFGHAPRLDGAALAALANEWRRNASVGSGVRRWADGHISHHGDDYYDGLLLAQCDDDWQAAEQVVGSAQWECDEFLGDVFFAWRLRCLAQAGRLLWRGPAARLAEAVVRLVAPAGPGAVVH